MQYDTSHIQKILNLSDESAAVIDIVETDSALIVFIEKADAEQFCEHCGERMLSKGPRTRTVNHPVFQDGRSLTLIVKSRKWWCPHCDIYKYDQFGFLEKHKRNSKIVPLIILDKMKNLNNTAVSISQDLNVSDTYVHEVFMQYVDLPRLPLCTVLSIDEVHLRFDKNNLYALVLMNWETGEIIDILPNRHKSTIENYLRSIPREERDNVKFLVSDMYDTYTDLAGTWFRNAVSVIDCFHHTSPIIRKIQYYINGVKKRYQERDRKKLEEENYRNNRNNKTRKDSPEVHLLKTCDYFLLKNYDDISFEPIFRKPNGHHGGYWIYPRDKEKEFMALDDKFYRIRELKEKYIHFTRNHINDMEGAAKELDELIKEYSSCEISMFREFAYTLKEHKDGIIASFNYLRAERSDVNHELLRRISSGPMESYNNFPKDLKRVSNGVLNFQYTRNRLLWASRKSPAMLAVPKSRKEVHTKGNERGPYKKKGSVTE